MKQLACLGNVADVASLTLVYEETEAGAWALWEAGSRRPRVAAETAYTFLHDRIQQAAYSLIAEERRADVHSANRPRAACEHDGGPARRASIRCREPAHRGAARLIDHEEKAQVATINLRAGRKAKASAAYASACVYLSAGMALLDERDWSQPSTS